MLACSFDFGTRLLTSKGPDRHTDTVCPHLSPGLDYLLTGGARITEINRMAWSLIDLDIVLDQARDPRALPASIREEAGAEAWINFDPHYPLFHGLVCAACRQALAWPHQRESED
jgi:hypothetical protein